ncbi:MAG: type VI secretion system tip protein VgrG [Polyangiaceae bacterium]|nr:type VI secretion system tip protein VgrG [Polyangiaceae bacterium]
MWSQPCEACRFGLGAWACGYDDVRSRVSPKVLTRYRQEEESWDQFLRTTGSEVRRRRDTRTVSGPSAEPRTANEPASIEGATTKIGRAPAIDASKAAAASKTGAEAAIGLANIAAGAGAAGAAGSEAAKDGFYTRAGTFRSDREAIAKGSKSLDRSQWDALLRDSNDARRQNVHIRIQADAFDCEEIEVRSLDGKEAISQLFSFEVLIVCPQEVELGDDHVGVDIAIVFERGGAPARTVHGMITQIDDRLETESEWRSYRLHIAPRLWRATLVSTQEVHVNISVPDLIRQKLELVGLEEGQDFELRLRGTYPVRELIVQYKETDVAFISRLAEHLGICFFFEHGSGVDKLVFSDDNAGFAPLERAEIPFVRQGQRVDVFDIESRRRAFPSRFAMQDYNYRIPTIDLTSTFDTEVGLGGGVVEYGAHYKVPADGVALARLRAEEQAIANRYFLGKSDVAELDPGGRFTLVDHPKIEVPAFLVVEVVHRAVQGVKMTAGAVEPYVNSFRVIDLEMAYRPPRITPRPRIDGVVTALVEPDPSGIVGELAQIDVDGRYTVQFYFDAGDITGKAKHSHPVRMIQPHSGPHYGIHFPLKPGVEVLIVFMDGDPDRPLIIGSVPNPVTPSPVVEQVNLMNRIETASGLIIEMRDAVPPHVK